jgi:hypothetical protein
LTNLVCASEGDNGYTSEEARMRSEDTGDRGGMFVVLVTDIFVDEEVEWDRAPEGAPQFEDEACPYGVLRGKEGYDDTTQKYMHKIL